MTELLNNLLEKIEKIKEKINDNEYLEIINCIHDI
jgi:hypothetical protein